MDESGNPDMTKYKTEGIGGLRAMLERVSSIEEKINQQKILLDQLRWYIINELNRRGDIKAEEYRNVFRIGDIVTIKAETVVDIYHISKIYDDGRINLIGIGGISRFRVDGKNVMLYAK